MCLLREVGHIDTCKANRLEVADITHFLHHCCIPAQWYLELIPLHRCLLLVAQCHLGLHDAGDMLLTHALQVLFADGYMVAIESFAIVQGVILVDILYIGLQAGCCTICRIRIHFWRVALRTIITLVAIQHTHLVSIVVIATVVVVVIARRVIQWRERIILPHRQYHRIHLITQRCHIICIWFLAVVFK